MLYELLYDLLGGKNRVYHKSVLRGLARVEPRILVQSVIEDDSFSTTAKLIIAK